jgi:hypothetical protein
VLRTDSGGVYDMCIYVCMYVCIYIYIHIYIHSYVNIHVCTRCRGLSTVTSCRERACATQRFGVVSITVCMCMHVHLCMLLTCTIWQGREAAA